MAEALGQRQQISKENIRRYLHERHLRYVTNSEMPGGELSVDFDVYTLSRNRYTLRLYVFGNFPESSPKLAVGVRDGDFRKRNGKPIPDCSPEFQTSSRQDGFQTIALTFPTTANQSVATYMNRIYIQGIVWLSAYEEYIATGLSVREFVQEYRRAEIDSRETADVTFWSPLQVNRIAREITWLHENFGRDKVHWNRERRTVEVTITPTAAFEPRTYIFRIHLHHDYPNSCPRLAIAYPEELFQVDGQPIPQNSEEFRTIDKKDGHLSICHFDPREWMDNCQITMVIMRGQAWVNAYEQYLMENGRKGFSDCLREQQQCTEGNE